MKYFSYQFAPIKTLQYRANHLYHSPHCFENASFSGTRRTRLKTHEDFLLVIYYLLICAQEYQSWPGQVLHNHLGSCLYRHLGNLLISELAPSQDSILTSKRRNQAFVLCNSQLEAAYFCANLIRW